MFYAIIRSQFKDLSIDLFLTCLNLQPYRHASYIKNWFFASHFLNLNIEVTIKQSNFRFSVIILDIMKKVTVSPIYFLLPSFILFNVKNIVQKNVKKFPVFCYKIKPRA